MTDKLATYESEAPTMLAAAKALDITTEAGEAAAEAWFLQARTWVKTAEAELVEPWRDVKRNADAQMKKIMATIINPVSTVVETLRTRIATQRREREEAAQKAARAAQAAIDAQVERDRQAAIRAAEKLKTPELREARLEAAQNMVAPVVDVATSAKPAGSRLVSTLRWGYVIDDESKIPDEYRKSVPDLDKINDRVQALKRDANIPGVRVVSKDSVR